MKKETFTLLENYMLSCMQDAAHDKDHVYRVLYTAMEIAENENVNKDVLIAACLLHDIARKDQMENPAICHAELGAEKAEAFLLENGFAPDFAAHVHDCIYTHRFRKASPPATMEARISMGSRLPLKTLSVMKGKTNMAQAWPRGRTM